MRVLSVKSGDFEKRKYCASQLSWKKCLATAKARLEAFFCQKDSCSDTAKGRKFKHTYMGTPNPSPLKTLMVLLACVRIYARAARYDETEEIEKRHTTVKRQIYADGLRRLALKMDRERPVFRSLVSVIIITIFFVPCAVVIALKAVISATKKICGYVQHEVDLFHEFYEDDKMPLWDEAGFFEGFIKGEDYEVCFQSKKKNSLSVWTLPLVTEEIFTRNFALGSRLQCAPSQVYSSTSSKCVLVGDHESQDSVKFDASVRSSNHQAANDNRKGRNKLRPMNGSKVQCKAVVTTLIPLTEIMTILSRSKVRKDKPLKKSLKTGSSYCGFNIAKKRSEPEAADGDWSKQAVKKQRTKRSVAEQNLHGKIPEPLKSRKKNKKKTSKKHRNSYTEVKRSGSATAFIGQIAETMKPTQESVNESKMVNATSPLPVTPFNVQSTEESIMDIHRNQKSLPDTPPITELVSLMEQLHITPYVSPPCDVPEFPDTHLLLPDVSDSESDDECEGEYDLFPELQSMPEQVLQIMQMLP